MTPGGRATPPGDATDDARLDEPVGGLTAGTRHHVQDEQEESLPRMRERGSRKQVQDLAALASKVRADQAAPDRPPANMVPDPDVRLIDLMRDALGTRR